MSAVTGLARTLGLPVLLVVGLIAIVILLWLTRKYSKQLPTAGTWTSYLKGQGALLFVSLLLGGTLAWVGSSGLQQTSIRNHGKLIEFRQLDPSQQPIFKDVDVENFAEITVLTKTDAPQNGSATVTLYPEPSGTAGGQIQRIESRPEDWSRWDQPNSSKRLSFMVAPSTQPGSIPASQMDVLIYLTPKQNGSERKF